MTTTTMTAAPPCYLCRERPRTRGLLCGSCASCVQPERSSDVDAALELCPEQFGARLPAPVPGHVNAWLFDPFGVPHTVSVDKKAPLPWSAVSLGRDRKSDVWVAERTVSSTHALLEYRALSNAWFVVDAGADNGTFVGADDRVRTRFPLEPRDRIWLGRRVSLLFARLEDADVDEAIQELRWLHAQAQQAPTFGDAGADVDTPLRISAVKDGGAVATWASSSVPLSELEYELLVVLHGRFVDDADADASARGFVPAAQLLEQLSFHSEAPTHANLRGLVRKLRKKLAEGEPPLDVIESRQGLGYRLARPLTLR